MRYDWKKFAGTMEGSFYRTLFSQLQSRKVRYVLCGGLAVNLHGVPRVTADADLIVDFKDDNIERFVLVMNGLGMRSMTPVDPMDLANPEKRGAWRSEKGSVVFQFVNTSKPFLKVDVFLEHPLPFDELWSARRRLFFQDVEVSVACLEHLIALKQRVIPPREQDLSDINALGRIRDILKRRKKDE